MFIADQSGAGAGSNTDLQTVLTGGEPGILPPAAAAAGASLQGDPLPGTIGTSATEFDQAPAFDPEPPIETPTPTQAEIDDAKRGVRQPDPPAAQVKKVRNMKPGRDGASTTRDL